MSQSPAVNRPMTALEWATLITLAAVWGGTFFFNAIVVKDMPVFTIVVARVALAALVLLAVLKLAGIGLPKGRRVWLAFFGMGLLNNAIPFSLIVWGQQHIASGVASILNASPPPAVGGENPPAATDCAMVMVVSGSFSAERLSHEPAAVNDSIETQRARHAADSVIVTSFMAPPSRG